MQRRYLIRSFPLALILAVVLLKPAISPGITAQTDGKESLFLPGNIGFVILTGLIVILLFYVVRLKQQIARTAKRENQDDRTRLDDSHPFDETIQNCPSELNAIYDLAPAGLACLDRHFRLVRMNKTLADINNVSPDGDVGKSVFEILPDFAPMLYKIHSEILKTGKPVLNTQLKQTDVAGEERQWVANFSPLLSEDGTIVGIAVAFIEVTAMMESEEEIIKAKEAAEAANEAKSLFLSNMSHEIKTPLNSIMGFTQILMNRTQSYDIPDEFTGFLSNIKQSAQELATLITNLIEQARIDTGMSEVKTFTTSIRDISHVVIKQVQLSATRKNINLIQQIPEDIEDAFETDRPKLVRALISLLQNAIKFTPSGKTVTLSISKDSENAIFSVIDEGIGISQDQLNIIFEKFEQVDKTSTRQFGGTGIGLSSAKQLIELIGGTISVESKEGAGSTFSIQIPHAKNTEEPDDISIVYEQEEFFSPDNIVLIVEDDPVNRELISSFFDGLGLEATIVNDGLQGVDNTIRLKPDLVLMDIHMPELNGVEAIKQIRRNPECEQIPVIALSADDSQEQKLNALTHGFNEYLSKPFDFDDLVKLLLKYLKKRDLSEIEEKPPEFIETPPEIRLEIEKTFRELSEIPHDFSNKLLQKIDQIRKLAPSSDQRLLQDLREMENSIYECDNEKLEEMIAAKIQNK